MEFIMAKQTKPLNLQLKPVICIYDWPEVGNLRIIKNVKNNTE